MLDLALLGRFGLQLDGVAVELPSRPAQSLLAYLLLHHGVAHRRERLAGLLWPDTNESSARRNLRQALWQIRRALGAAADSVLQADDLTITVQLDDRHQLDVARLDRPLDGQLTLEELIERASAYAGELLPGFYDDWLLLERERLQAHFERTMQRLLDALVEDARWPQVLEWAERWIALGHTPEPAYRAAMLAHAAQGDSARMAESYRRCVEALERDLGVEPSEQTRQLFERLRNGQAPVPAPTPAAVSAAAAPAADPVSPPHNLPVHLTSFIGRTEEIATIRRQLQEHRLVTLTGSGGAGKTRLALQVAHTFLNPDAADAPAGPARFKDGIWLVELAPISQPEGVARLVASVLGVREESCCSLTQLLIESLRDQQVLLLLDNCEHLLDACARLVEDLLRACPSLTILTTSREMLGMIGEIVFRVPPLSLPALSLPADPAVLLQFEAVRLFVERAKAVRPDFQHSPQNVAAVVQICRKLDGVPLAIELAAARVRSMTPEQINARLDDRFRLLTGGSRTAMPRQQTLRALIDWSWDLLTDDERTLLRRLSVFRGGWTLEAAEIVCADCGPGADAAESQTANAKIPNVDVLDLLTHLVDKSLVVLQEQAGEARYDLLESIRQYALEQLNQAGEAALVQATHAAYFLGLAEQAEPHLRTGEQLHWLARLQAEHDNLRVALAWTAAQGRVESGLRLAGSLARYWYLRGYWREGRSWLRQLLAADEAASQRTEDHTRARIRALCGAGWLADEDGSERPLYSEALALSRQVGDRWSEAFALRGISSVTTNWSDLEQAGPQLEQALHLFCDLGDDWGVGLVRFNQGWLVLELDNPAAAEAYWQEALTRFRACGDRWGLAVTTGALGYVARGRNEYDHAAHLMHESLRWFRELGDLAGVSLSLNRLGNLAFRRADYREATALLDESRAVLQEHHDVQAVMNAFQVQGLVAGMQGNYEQAQALLQQSIDYARDRQIEFELGYGLSYLGYIHYLQNDIAQAAQRLAESLASFEQGQDREGLAFTHYGLGMVALHQGDLAQAQHWLQTSLVHYRARGDKRYIALVLDGLGRLAQVQGDGEAAPAYFRESLILRKQIVDRQGIAESLERLATTADELKHGVQLLAAADGLRQTIGAPLPPVDQPEQNRLLERARAALGESHFAELWRAGRQLSFEGAIGLALADLNPAEN
jgi:predicted ATPase/DNA-binding SARP family transcriptional activator